MQSDQSHESSLPRAARAITIGGQFAREVLGTFRVIRGFATVRDRATIWAPYRMDTEGQGDGARGHQRDIDPDRTSSRAHS